jgi:subtilisin family serine protease
MPQEPVRLPLRRARTNSVRRASLGLAALLLAAALAACTKAPPREDPPPPPPTTPTLSAPGSMIGVTTGTLQVRAEQAWQLTVEPAPGGSSAIVSRVSLGASSGSGNATVALTVDPAGLSNIPDYQFVVRLSSAGHTVDRTVLFTFPHVTGYALRSTGATGAGVQPLETAGNGVWLSPTTAGEQPRGPGGSEPTGAAQHPLASAPAGEAEVGGETVTLIVGLQAADAGLAAQGLAGAPAASAVHALTTAVAQLNGARVQSRFDAAGLVLVEVPAADAALAQARLEGARGVRYVELPVPVYPFANDEFRHLQWNLDRVQAEQLWEAADGTGVTIAVLDNGFYPRHPDLAPNLVGQYDAGDLKGSVEATNPACGTHGTHVAGIAAAVANNGVGVAGAAPGAGLYLVDLDYENQPGCPMNAASLIRGIEHVVNGGAPLAQVMNLSLGSSLPLGNGTQDALQAARNAGIIIVGAAGNTACPAGQATFDPVSYPAAYSQVWAVGATDPANQRACYSHVGPELFIAAPGGNSFGANERYDMVLSTDYDMSSGTHNYGWMEGTSMAAPMVAGVVALLKSADPGATDNEIRQALIAGATDLGAPGRDPHFGYGLVNAAASYEALVGTTEPPPPPPPPPPPVGAMRLVVPGYPVATLDADGIFTLTNAPTGPLTIVVESDEDGDGEYAEPGEYYGEVTINVQFDQTNQAVVFLDQQ